jgi:hypothetical protein
MRNDDDTRNIDNRSRRNEKDHRLYKKASMTEYEKLMKEEDTKNPVANTIPKNNPIPKQKYPKVHFLNFNPTRN